MTQTKQFAPGFRLDGKVALVTGASRGIGYGLAHALAEVGATLAVSARDEKALATLAGELPGSLVVPMDMRSVSSIREGVARVEKHFGRVDILVNNAGLGGNQSALEVTESEWDELMDVNLK
ncbi:MAG TPA: SDR family NAD(P)-dependent oxidoreductase, partial [Polyangiaceae bacterium]